MDDSSWRTRSRTDPGFVRLGVYSAQILFDLIAVSGSFFVANWIRNGYGFRDDDLRIALFVIPIFLLVSLYTKSYSLEAMQSYQVAIGRTLRSLLITLAISLLFVFAQKQSESVSRIAFAIGASLALVLLLAGRLPIIWFVRHRLSRRFVRRVLIVDETPASAPALFDAVNAEALSLKPDLHDPIQLHNFSWLVAGYDRVVVSCPPERREAWSLYLQAVGCVGELIVPELRGIAPTYDGQSDGLPGVRVSIGPLDLPDRMLKRLLDLAITIPTIILLSPLLLFVVIAVKLDSPGPVLFRQQRIGRSNRLFNVYKFRSMRAERSDSAGDRSASRDDDRVTRVGRFIRATSIDELPQLFNVLEGDMALVGPRPHALGSRAGDDLFWQVDQRYWLRHSIKPGITGLAQVRGYRGATDHRDDLSNRLRSDLEYVSNWSILRDMAILLRTARVVIHSKAY